MTLQRASLVTSIFPERDNSCYFLVQESDDGTLCKMPLGYKENKELEGLMTLKNFIEGGYDVDDGKILVCVKSIGTKRKRRLSQYDPHICHWAPWTGDGVRVGIILIAACSHNEERQISRKGRRQRIRSYLRSDSHSLGQGDGFRDWLDTLPNAAPHF